MGSLCDDLDKFLKTDGIKIIIDSKGTRVEPYEPLTEDDIDDFADMDLDELDETGLEDLLEKAEELQDEMADREPEDENSETHDTWEGQIIEIEDFIERIRDRLDDLEDEESNDNQ